MKSIVVTDASRAEALLRPLRADADRFLMGALWLGFLVALAIGQSQKELDIAARIGLPIALLMTVLVVLRAGDLITRLAMGAALMSMVALHIHLSHGLIETHFGVFVVLALLLAYRDWRVIALAAGIIAVHHLTFNHLQAAGWNLFCLAKPSLEMVLYHAGYVVAQSGFEIVVAMRLRREALEGHELDRMVRQITLNTDGRLDVTARDGGLTPMGSRLREALQAIALAVRDVRDASQQIQMSAREVNRGAQDLSHRTEQQASSLEQTASAVRDMAGNVKRTAQATREAAQLTSNASGMAQQGRLSVEELVQSMDEIGRSSARIADITGVIDSIAFQTNLLALNAAVEAARAGEHGKGFAVVASEVRNLAQRSATAAREVRELIEQSNVRISQGVNQADVAGSTINQLVESVQRVTALVRDVDSSTARQAAGVTEFESAINQLEQTTQGNSALAEQSAAAGESLLDLADALAQIVSRFESDDENVSTRPTGRQTAERKVGRSAPAASHLPRLQAS